MAASSVIRHFSNQAGSFSQKRLGTTILVRVLLVFVLAGLSPTAVNPALLAASVPTLSRQLQEGNQPLVSDSDRSIQDLIAQLGDSHYIVRDEAETKLLKIGGPAISHLRDATAHRNAGLPDSEIRLRATRLLILIERKERERKIQEFLAGKPNSLEFAGWSEFSKIVGTDTVARKLFVDMHQAQPILLKAIEQGQKPVEEAFQTITKSSLRSNSYSNANQMIGTLTALLFVSALEFVSDDEPTHSKISVSEVDLGNVQRALTQTQMITFVNSSGTQAYIGRLISRWLETLSNDKNSSVNIQLATIGAYRLVDRLESVLKFASDRRLPPPTRINSIEIFGKLATRQNAAKIRLLFDDSTVIGNYLPRTSTTRANGQEKTPEFNRNRPKLMQVQFRDLALATSIKLHKQNLRDFGFDPRCYSGDRLISNYGGFHSDDERKVAFTKWKQFASIESDE